MISGPSKSIIDWELFELYLRDVRRALLRDNIDPNRLPAFSINRAEQMDAIRHYGTDYLLYNRIAYGKFEIHGFRFVLASDQTDQSS